MLCPAPMGLHPPIDLIRTNVETITAAAAAE
jgi:hypothetical protein